MWLDSEPSSPDQELLGRVVIPRLGKKLPFRHPPVAASALPNNSKIGSMGETNAVWMWKQTTKAMKTRILVKV
jgi:hypothetical protein